MEIENFKCSQTDSNMNFATWNTLFLSVLNKHAPIKEKCVKRTSKPVLLTEEITSAQQNKITIIKNKNGKNLSSGAIRLKISFALPKKISSKIQLTKTKIVHFFGNMLKHNRAV